MVGPSFIDCVSFMETVVQLLWMKPLGWKGRHSRGLLMRWDVTSCYFCVHFTHALKNQPCASQNKLINKTTNKEKTAADKILSTNIDVIISINKYQGNNYIIHVNKVLIVLIKVNTNNNLAKVDQYTCSLLFAFKCTHHTHQMLLTSKLLEVK